MSRSTGIAMVLLLACGGPSGRAVPDATSGPGGPGQDGDGNSYGSSSCEDGNTEQIYLLDRARNVFAFDPIALDMDQDPFTLLGPIACPAQLPPTGGTASVFPMSIAIDRDRVLWILYSTGEIFKAPVDNLANCQPTPYVANQQGFALFGMSFSSNTQGGDEETLFVSTIGDTPGLFGGIEPQSVALSVIGTLPAYGASGSELTGTGSGELYLFDLGESQSRIRQIDKASANYIGDPIVVPRGLGQTWTIGTAFAHWGGRLYVFLGTDNDYRIHVVNLATGVIDVPLTNVPILIDSAAVSTCAPFIIE